MKVIVTKEVYLDISMMPERVLELEKELERVNRKLSAMHTECSRLKRGVVILTADDKGRVAMEDVNTASRLLWCRISSVEKAKLVAIERAERLQKLYFKLRREKKKEVSDLMEMNRLIYEEYVKEKEKRLELERRLA